MLLTSKQAAERLNITTRQLAAFVADGAIEYINVGRGKKLARLRFSERDIDCFIEWRRTRKGATEVRRKRSRPAERSAMEETWRRAEELLGCKLR